MLFNLRLLISFIRKFGVYKGLVLFLKIKTNATQNLSISELKFPFTLRPNTSDIYVFYQVFSEREYDNCINFEPKVIIDAGANIGLTSLFYANKYPQALIIAIEPDAENYETLVHNCKPYNNIKTLQKGLWHKDAKLKISDKFKGGKWAMVVEEVIDNNDFTIDAISLNSILKEFNINKIDILKMDIESAEKEVLSENYELWLPKVKMLIVELHDRMKPGCSNSFINAIHQCMPNLWLKARGETMIATNENI